MKRWLLALGVVGAACGTPAPTLGRGYTASFATDTCASGQRWTAGTSESESMNPGEACRSCHLGENLQGQNPGGAAEPEKAYFFMGTAYSAAHEENLCAAAGVPAGTVVEILDTNDVVQLTLPVNAAGNFRSTRISANVPVPYKARVRTADSVNAMATPQTNGDCNSCHTAEGTHSAPGRIRFPL